MSRRSIKILVLSAMMGTVMQLGGCVSSFFGGDFFLDLTRSALYEFIWDNDVTLDFFGDDGPGLIT